MLGTAVLISMAGLISMESFSATSPFADRQIIWLTLGLCAFFAVSSFDLRILRRTSVVTILYALSLALLALLFVAGSVFGGAQGWFNLGAFAVQPADPAKLALILVLAKYFSRRHIEIAHMRHIIVSGVYAFLVIALLFFQPDFGSAMVVALLWLGMALVAGISRKHILLVGGILVLVFVTSWLFFFKPYQKARLVSFVNPTSDIRGSGYNAYQSVVAVGSGGVIGKGLGYGTQSRLNFLPEYQTDFVFAAFSEEWGFFGGFLILFCFWD
jgi:rod shape determining protein RodA